MTIIDRDMLGLVFDIERFLLTIFGLDYLYETCAFSFCYPRGRFGQSLYHTLMIEYSGDIHNYIYN